MADPKIVTHPANKAYRDNWALAFGEPPRGNKWDDLARRVIGLKRLIRAQNAAKRTVARMDRKAKVRGSVRPR